MKSKILLFLLLIAGVTNAQDTIRSLIFTDVNMSRFGQAQVEITNMGDTPVQLNQFKFAQMDIYAQDRPIYDVYNDQWNPAHRYFFLPTYTLKPGESYVLANAYDFGPAMYQKGELGYAERYTQTDIYDVADFLVHMDEEGYRDTTVTDSVTTMVDSVRYRLHNTLYPWNGGVCFYLEHHLPNGDSAVVDQVGGVFDYNGVNGDVAYDVAGVEGATGFCELIRKYSINTGNLDFANARGQGLDDSEWLPIPRPESEGYDYWRDLWWTVGNHGNYVLDQNTLEPKTEGFTVDYAGKKITVPWGTRRLDDIMRNMVKKPGIAWNYILNDNQTDSLYRSARTGDQLIVYVCGTTLETATFDITVADPPDDANIVIPMDHKRVRAAGEEGGPIVLNPQKGILSWPRVTSDAAGIDTITGNYHGLPNALRTDSLLKYLEKAPDASWEIVFDGGTKRADLKNGDILKVTAKNGETKEYFIKVQSYLPSTNNNLASITWPDIPAMYRGLFGWQGDTIPNFDPNLLIYRIKVPIDYDGIPALVAKAEDLNSRVQVQRAFNLAGDKEARTISFTVVAENDSAKTYQVELVKDKLPQYIQPYQAEPFLSEMQYKFRNNSFIEICNPGTVPLDLSDYMIMQMVADNPADAISSLMETDVDTWLRRYEKYVPGYKWVDSTQWGATPGILERDLNVNSIIQPGDVFCAGVIINDSYSNNISNQWYDPHAEQSDVLLINYDGNIREYRNPWGEDVDAAHNIVNNIASAKFYILKILNDSIKQGTKPANDPNDFEVVEVLGTADGDTRVYYPMWDWYRPRRNHQTFIRKPEFTFPNPDLEGSNGHTADSTEWIHLDRSYFAAQGIGWPWREVWCETDYGQHIFDAPTQYMSTVASFVYKVSPGYSLNENIRGVMPGTTAGELFDNLLKADSAQSLAVKSTADGSELSMDQLLNLNDTLVVLSADSSNTTKYILNVSEDGLSSDALLTSERYEIELEVDPKSGEEAAEDGSGYVSGFEYGTTLRTVINGIDVPEGALMTIVNENGAYVPYKVLNYDTMYVDVTVNSSIYLDVLAENGVTRIIYQLIPEGSANQVFALSDVYNVKQQNNLIEFIPTGTTASTLLSNIMPSAGASLKLVDKTGIERTEGAIYRDDKVVVTSEDGSVTRVYHLSMLEAKITSSTTYLAYVLSDVYNVDQVNYVITGPTGVTMLTEFNSYIEPCMGATVVVVDNNGMPKTDGDLDEGDMLKVTSGDGKIEVMYDIQVDVTSTIGKDLQRIEIYPNPTSGRLNIRGVMAGNRIQLINAVGSVLRNVNVRSNPEVISLDGLPSGMFMIFIHDEDKLIGRYKAIKK